MNNVNDKKLTRDNDIKTVAPPFKGDVLAKGIVTGVAVSTINHTGKSLISGVIKHPLLLFGFGLTTGYFIGKYRKEIIGLAEQAGDQSTSFALKQKEKFLDMVAESQEENDSQN